MKKELFLLLTAVFLAACVSEQIYISECDNQETQGERDICYNNHAIVNHDFRYCDKISEKEKQDWCTMMVEKAIGPRQNQGWFD